MRTLEPATRALFLRGLLFFSPLILGTGYVEYRLRHVGTNYSEKRVALDEKAPRIEALILGASDAHAGIRAEMFPLDAYNAAISAQSLFYDVAILEKYIDSMPKLRFVLFTMNMTTSGWRMVRGEPGRVALYERYFGLPPDGDVDPWGIERVSMIAAFTPSITYEMIRSGFVAPPVDNDHGTEESNDESHVSRCEVTARALLSRHSVQDEAPIADLLRRTLSMLRGRGIATGVVVMPESAPLIEAAGRSDSHTLEAIAAREGAVLSDYFDDPRFVVPDFRDCDHLNRKGAEKLTRLILQDVVGPALSQGRAAAKP